MPWPTKRFLEVIVLSLFALCLVRAGIAQDITVAAGTPVSLTAYSPQGQPNNGTFPCGQNFGQTCTDTGTSQPNGNINWTVDGAPASSSYDNVASAASTCGYDDSGREIDCYVYWDESGFYSVLPPGDHVVMASIPVSQDPYAAFTTSWTVRVLRATPSISVFCSPNPITFGNQNTTCTASQSGGTGSLSWTINGGAWTTTGINGSAGGFAGWGAGNYTIGVSYSGDNNYAPVSTSTVLTINKSTLNVTVSCSPNPISYGSQTSTCTAQTAGGSGTITTYWDGNAWCSGAAPGPVSCTGWNGQPVGNHTFSANYSGDGNYNSASASTALVINQGPAPVSISCSPNTLKVGQQTTCTASIPGGIGTVAFYWPTTLTGQWWNGNTASWYPPNGGNLSAVPSAITHDGTLNYNLSNSGSPTGWPNAIVGPAGVSSQNIYARWTGTFASAISGTYTIGVNSDDGATLYVNGTKLVDSLSGIQGAAGNLAFTQSGTINLAAGATNTIVVEYQQNLGDAGIQLLWIPPGFSSPSLLGWTVAPLDANGHASVTGSVLVAGTSTVTAAYSGDANYSASSSSTTVTAVANTVTQITSDIETSNAGQSVTFSALVNAGGSAPSGPVTFLDGSSQIGSANVSLTSATNYVRHSQQIGDPSNWGGYCGPTNNMTMNTQEVPAPDGSHTATKFVTPSTSGCAGVAAQGAIDFIGGLTAGQSYTVSVWLRGAVLGTNVILAVDDCQAQQFSIGTTWKRYTYTVPSYSICEPERGLQFLSWDQNATYYVWGAQMEQTQTAGPYIQTDASSRSGYGGISSLTTNSLTQGTHSISASYQGNATTSASTSLPISQYVGTLPPSPPNISNITPSSGYPGTMVTINGVNFGASQGSNSVAFNGFNANVSSWSDSSITAQVPANATSGNVIVVVNGLPSNGTPFTVNSGPPPQGVSIYSYEIKDGGGNSGYASNGNIIAYSDSVNGTWSNIGYDNLNRLTNATQEVNGNSQNLCWSYDQFGNRTSSVCNPSSYIQYTTNNRDASLQYDAGGNLTGDGAHQYLYDAEGRVCAVQYTVMTIPAMVGYIYDAEGQQVAKGAISHWSCDTSSNGFQETAGYVLGPNGEDMTETDGQGNWAHTNVYAKGELIATYTPSSLSFHLNDWLGTRRMDTDPFGNMGATYQSMPFGELLNPAQSITSPPQFFTGKERDSESGNDYFGARYYASTMGRFMSPDSSASAESVPYANLSDPQSLNLYAYGRNNPLRFVDIDGHDSIDCSGQGSLDALCETIKDEDRGSQESKNRASSHYDFSWGSLLPNGTDPIRYRTTDWEFTTNPNTNMHTGSSALNTGASWLENSLYNLGTFSSGAGDILSLGITKKINQWDGGASSIGYNSGLYTAGKVTGITIGVVDMTAGALTRAAYVEGATAIRMADSSMAGGRQVGRVPIGGVFGRGSGAERGLLNRGPLRFGWSWEGTNSGGRYVIRLGIGKGTAWWNHLNFWIY